VAIIILGEDKKILSGLEVSTTHNRMELTAVIKALEFLKDFYKDISSIKIYSDSQYVTDLESRKERLKALGFISKKRKELPNADLVKTLLRLYELYTVETIKIKAHQKKHGINDLNVEADILSRQMVREAVKKGFISRHQS